MSKGLADLAAIVGTGTETPSAPISVSKETKKEEKAVAPVTKADKFATLKAVEKALNKQFSTTCSLVRLGSQVGIPIPSISTGLPSLDEYVLGCGGVPRGKIIEIFGPESSGKTTIALHIIAQEQKHTDNLCAVVDAEHALDPTYAAKLGVNVDELLISQPNNGEEALETVEALIDSKAVSVILVDSVAALVPRAELDGEMGDSNMGLHARLMSQACRKLTAKASVAGVTVIFINQLRSKIGVIFGCFNYNARVLLADGSSEKIGKIVNQKVPYKVLSLNTTTGAIEPRKIVNWFDNGNVEKFLQIETTTAHNKSGRNAFGVTENHLIFTPEGQVEAGNLKVGDSVVGLGYKRFNRLQTEVAIGSVLGDGSIRTTGTHNTTLRITHGKKQTEYCKWKEALFGTLAHSEKVGDKGSYGFFTESSFDLTEIRKHTYREDRTRTITDEFLSKLTVLGVAIWYMDDGTFGGSYQKWGRGKSSISAKSYNTEDRSKLADKLESLGFPKPALGKHGRLDWYGEDSFKFQEKLCPCVHPSMEYKIHPELRGRFDSVLFENYQATPSHVSVIFK
jgi:recombination protein RecA